MANEKHVERLKGGVDHWNEWREEHLEVRPDLRSADLYGANVARANLTRANLTRANLTRADLRRADLRRAILRGADLRRADLGDTDLTRADLTNADLSDANLNDANLSGANLLSIDLLSADLRGADLSGANLLSADLAFADLACADITSAGLGYTTFAHVDLRQVNGLDSVTHHAPSTIGTDTLDRSHGQIPHAFLKGCGLKDWQIENAKLFDPALNTDQRTTIWYENERIRGEQPINPFRVFISYTREDRPFVEALEKRLDEKGIRYWRNVHHLKAGRLERQIDRAIDLNPLVLLVLSERSVESDWVRWEAEKARKLERQYREQGYRRDVLCPVALDDAWKDCDWPGRLRTQIEDYNILDFSGWEGADKMARQFTKLYEGVILNYKN